MIGKTISHYRIIEKLGEGGMGVVYKAEDTKLGRTVALKFLPPNVTRSEEEKARFVHEAQAAAALNHPSICTVYEIDEFEGRSFIAMEYIEGESLRERIEGGPLALRDVIGIGLQVSDGLGHAHGHGIVHRDIKSANIMVTREGRAKITDFGLAKSRGGTKITKESTTLGTIEYMSPEQARGAEVDHRTDIWSLGVVLYEMVAGRAPFRGEYEQAVIYSILSEEPEPLTALRTGVPVELERIVDKCLEKDPGERYQTASDLSADLRRLQRTLGAGAETSGRSREGASAGRAGGRRWGYGTAAVLVVAVASAALWFEVNHRTAVPAGEKSIAVLPFVDMSPQRDQEYFCDGMTEELINRLSNIQDLRVPARTSAFYFKGKTEDIREVGSKLNVQAVLEGSVRKAGDRLRITAQLVNVADGYHIWSETYDRRLEDVLAIQDEISSAIVNALELRLTPRERQRLAEHPIDNVKAYEYYLKASKQIWRFDERSLDSAFVNLQTAIDIIGDNALLYTGMSMAYAQYANIGLGQEDYFERAKEYARKALALKPDLGSALTMLGILSYFEDYPKNYNNLFHNLKKALASAPDDPEVLGRLAFTYAIMGRPSDAFAMTELLERRDPLNLRRYVVRGCCYLYDCQFGPALEQLQAYYRIDSTSPNAQFLYSSALVSNGKADEALAFVDRAEMEAPRNVTSVFCLLVKCALLKDKENALRLLTPEFQKTCRRDFEWSYNVAAGLSLAGATEDAFDWLDNAVHRGFINYPFMQCDPFLDDIRGDERFKKLMAWAKNEWEHFEVPE